MEKIQEQKKQTQGQFKEMCVDLQNRFVTVDEAAEYLSMKKSWIYQNHKILKMPSYKLNQTLLFKLNELDKWMTDYSINN